MAESKKTYISQREQKLLSGCKSSEASSMQENVAMLSKSDAPAANRATQDISPSPKSFSDNQN